MLLGHVMVQLLGLVLVRRARPDHACDLLFGAVRLQRRVGEGIAGSGEADGDRRSDQRHLENRRRCYPLATDGRGTM